MSTQPGLQGWDFATRVTFPPAFRCGHQQARHTFKPPSSPRKSARSQLSVTLGRPGTAANAAKTKPSRAPVEPARKLRKRTGSRTGLSAPPTAVRFSQSPAPRLTEVSRASPRVSRSISGSRWSVGGVPGGPPPGVFSYGSGRGGVALGRSQGSESEFPSCASAASKVRVRPHSGRVDLTFRGLRGGGFRDIGNPCISRTWRFWS